MMITKDLEKEAARKLRKAFQLREQIERLEGQLKEIRQWLCQCGLR
jgi:hypothetical protein